MSTSRNNCTNKTTQLSTTSTKTPHILVLYIKIIYHEKIQFSTNHFYVEHVILKEKQILLACKKLTEKSTTEI